MLHNLLDALLPAQTAWGGPEHKNAWHKNPQAVQTSWWRLTRSRSGLRHWPGSLVRLNRCIPRGAPHPLFCLVSFLVCKVVPFTGLFSKMSVSFLSWIRNGSA